jgi:general L-amino acid transport system substrate-binding protein
MSKNIVKGIINSLAFLALSMTGIVNVASAATLQEVEQRGAVRCGVNPQLLGFASKDKKGNWSGFDVDVCRAVAAAVFNDPDKVQYTEIPVTQRFKALLAGKIDVLVRTTTWTLTRDTGDDVNFAGVNYYDGQGFLVHKELGVRSALGLDGARVCVIEATTSIKNLNDYFVLNRMKYELKSYPGDEEARHAYENKQCDALTSDQSGLYSILSQLKDPRGSKVLPEVISKEPLGPAVRENDDQWADIVRWSLYIMINAEELGISSGNVDHVREVSRTPAIRRMLGLEGDIGSGLGLGRNWAYNIIRHVGNYAESFDRNVGKNSPLNMKRGLNANWRNGGILYAPPVR